MTEDAGKTTPRGVCTVACMATTHRATGNWAICWLDGRAPHVLDAPVVGRFAVLLSV